MSEWHREDEKTVELPFCRTCMVAMTTAAIVDDGGGFCSEFCHNIFKQWFPGQVGSLYTAYLKAKFCGGNGESGCRT